MSNNDKKLEELYSFMDEVTQRLEELIRSDEPEESPDDIKGKYCTATHFFGPHKLRGSWYVSLNEETAPPGAKMHRGFYDERSHAKNVMNEIDEAMTFIMTANLH